MIPSQHYLLSSTWGQNILKLDKLLEGKESSVRSRFKLRPNIHSCQMIHICILQFLKVLLQTISYWIITSFLYLYFIDEEIKVRKVENFLTNWKLGITFNYHELCISHSTTFGYKTIAIKSWAENFVDFL